MARSREEKNKKLDRKAIEALRNHSQKVKGGPKEAAYWVQARQLEVSLEIANSLSLIEEHLNTLVVFEKESFKRSGGNLDDIVLPGKTGVSESAE